MVLCMHAFNYTLWKFHTRCTFSQMSYCIIPEPRIEGARVYIGVCTKTNQLSCAEPEGDTLLETKSMLWYILLYHNRLPHAMCSVRRFCKTFIVAFIAKLYTLYSITCVSMICAMQYIRMTYSIIFLNAYIVLEKNSITPQFESSIHFIFNFFLSNMCCDTCGLEQLYILFSIIT